MMMPAFVVDVQVCTQSSRAKRTATRIWQDSLSHGWAEFTVVTCRTTAPPTKATCTVKGWMCLKRRYPLYPRHHHDPACDIYRPFRPRVVNLGYCDILTPVMMISLIFRTVLKSLLGRNRATQVRFLPAGRTVRTKPRQLQSS